VFEAVRSTWKVGYLVGPPAFRTAPPLVRGGEVRIAPPVAWRAGSTPDHRRPTGERLHARSGPGGQEPSEVARGGGDGQRGPIRGELLRVVAPARAHEPGPGRQGRLGVVRAVAHIGAVGGRPSTAAQPEQDRL